MDPTTFATWMHILQRVPHSVLWFQQYSGYAAAKKNLVRQAKQFGIDGTSRFIFTPMTAWINHTWVKQAADLVLDTALKNGHTTIVDALWAGLPLVTLQGDRMSNRAASSAVASMGDHRLNVMTTNSYKEYEDTAVRLARHPRLLASLRLALQRQRNSAMLFDTRSFAIGFGRNLMATWEWQREAWAMLASDSISKSMRHTHTTDLHRMHVVIPSQSRPTAQPSSDEEGSKDDDEAKESREPSTSVEVSTGEPPLLLHIGGHVPRDGWTVVNIQRLRHVDLVREMKDLHGIGANTVTAIYSSHALEHCGYGVHAADVSATLAEWHRVLKAGGALFLSVPDLSVLATLFVDPTLTPGQRFHVMRMMYGGQTDGHDFHKTGFDRVILDSFLTEAGFCNVTRVKSFGLFQDTSDLVFQGKSISLNVVAKACKRGQVPISVNLPATSPA